MSISKPKKPKIAIVHDFLTYFGGAERVLISLHKLYPDAPIYTLLYNEKKMKQYFSDAKIRTSFLNKLPKFIRKRKKYLLPFMPTAAETFDLREFDIVISSSSSFAKGIITKPKTTHICYCHTPTRFLWDWHYNYLKENNIKGIKKIIILFFLHYMRMWDKSAAERVDYFIANSKNTAQRIKKFYGRESKVVYPPCDVEYSNDCEKPKEDKKRYFLIVSRLSSYKKIDLAIEAFNKLEIPLIIIGEGEDRSRLRKMAEKNIKFLGFVSDEKLKYYYQSCQAFIFPGEDDFGITPIEAMSFGKPVLAYRRGGLKETIIEGITGEFFDDLIPEILADGVRRMKNNYRNYNCERIKQHSQKFSRKNFEENIKNIIEKI
ncbi:MAG: glycosyltransferase [Patescibacteria group bacterium]|nr:glycosyltransferase [Patescibacteria group bacterium]